MNSFHFISVDFIHTSTTAVEGVSIPWYIMGSEATGKTTREYFEKNNYFGLNPKNIFFFEQGMLPAITPEGKIIMESAARVSLAPDGNGGLYAGIYQLFRNFQ